MFTGVLCLELYLHNAHSLKDKRTVVNAILDRIRARFNVSACQLDDHDLWQRATLGVAVISNDAATANKVLNHVRDHVDEYSESDSRFDVVKCEIEITCQ